MIYSKLCLAKESNEKEPKKIKRKFRHVVRVCGLEMLVLDKQESDLIRKKYCTLAFKKITP